MATQAIGPSLSKCNEIQCRAIEIEPIGRPPRPIGMGGIGLVAFAYAVFLALAFLPSLVVGSLIGAVTTSRKVAVLITTALAIGSAGWMLGIDKLNAVQAIALAIYSAGLFFPAITGLWLARRMKKRFRQPAWLPRRTT